MLICGIISAFIQTVALKPAYILTVYQIVPLLRMKKARNYGLYKQQAMGIEPTLLAWKAGVLPLNHACNKTFIILHGFIGFVKAFYILYLQQGIELAFVAGGGYEVSLKHTILPGKSGHA